MNCRLPFEYSTPQASCAPPVSLSPSNKTTYLFPNWEFSPNSFVALFLRRSLHNFRAPKSLNHLNGVTYGRYSEKSRKSNAALLLPHVFAVSPLLRYSYKKMGGTPLPWDPTSNFRLSTLDRLRSSQCFLSLTRIRRNAPKTPQCFLSLTDRYTRNYLCFLSLKKKGGWGGTRPISYG
jgi:hypothetical protein